MPGYVYRGDQPDKTLNKPRRQTRFDPTKCGSYKGYRQHSNHGIPPCDACKAGLTEYVKARKKVMNA